MMVVQVFSICKTIFNVTNIAWIDTTLMSGHILIYCYVIAESEVVARKSSMKKVFLNIPQNSQENICAGVSFALKLQAEGL